MNSEQIELKEVFLKETVRVEKVTKRNKVGRNQKCICRSGKKYKKCCLKKQQVRVMR